MSKKYYTRPEAADYLTNVRGLPTTKGTLGKKATTGGGPIYELYGNKAIYTQPNLDLYADQSIRAPRRSTSEPWWMLAKNGAGPNLCADRGGTGKDFGIGTRTFKSAPSKFQAVHAELRGRSGFRQLYAWLNGADVRADRCEPLAVVPLKLAIEIATPAENSNRKNQGDSATWQTIFWR
jgi:hypothetical protein